MLALGAVHFLDRYGHKSRYWVKRLVPTCDLDGIGKRVWTR
jgi:hypothetical protein